MVGIAYLLLAYFEFDTCGVAAVFCVVVLAVIAFY